jgi:dienelactone hydrolase
MTFCVRTIVRHQYRNLKSLMGAGTGLGLFAGLVFLGSLVWAKSRDPFRRQEFNLKTASGRISSMAVVPKGYAKLPTVIYAHDSGGAWQKDGNNLRQLAELGLAAVAFDYDQTNAEHFDGELAAVLECVRRQDWTDTNAMAWIGFGLGAQHMLRYAVSHPDQQPQIYVQMAGKWIPELAESFEMEQPSIQIEREIETQSSSAAALKNNGLAPSCGELRIPKKTFAEIGSLKSNQRFAKGAPEQSLCLSCPVLFVHGENDDILALPCAKKLAGVLETAGTPVTLKIIPGEVHAFGAEHSLVVRLTGEYCKAKLVRKHPLPQFPKLHPRALLLYISPAFVWLGAWLYLRRKEKGTRAASLLRLRKSCNLSKLGLGLHVVAAALAILAVADTVLHVVPPRMKVNERTLDIARKHLLAPKWREDFETLAALPIWRGQVVGTLLEHVELAHYTVNELVNWKLDDTVYRQFVLSPVVEEKFKAHGWKYPLEQDEFNWRRELWENFYPLVRHENTTDAAAAIVVRFLRQRITVAPNYPKQRGVESIWNGHIANLVDFEIVYTAALRSVGVPARLSEKRQVEFWTGSEWRPAPRPLATTWVE